MSLPLYAMTTMLAGASPVSGETFTRPVRVHALAARLGVPSIDLLRRMRDLGLSVHSASSLVEPVLATSLLARR